MTKAFILAGTNLEDREANLEFARQGIGKGRDDPSIQLLF